MDLFNFRIPARVLGIAATAACLSTGILSARSETIAWTDDDTEWFWNRIVEQASRTSTTSRFAEADEEAGEGVLEAFGAQYLPNAYAYYQEVRATAKEREQLLRENFPDGRSSDATGGALYDKIQKATAKAVAEMFRRHDELCHYLLLYRMGAVSDRKLADRDSARISIVLPEETKPPEIYKRNAPVLSSVETDFATKYLPETRAAFQRLDNAFSEGVKTYGEWREVAILVDATRSESIFKSLRDRLDGIWDQMDGLVRLVREKKLLHAVGEATASDLADIDREKGINVQKFEKGLSVGPTVRVSVRRSVDHLEAPRLAEKQKAEDERIAREKREAKIRNGIPQIIDNMVRIPGRNYFMGKFEVTQAQWEAVMGYNPSHFKDLDNPVENVSWQDCQKFLEKLNGHPKCKKSGLTFRLPTAEEWEFACRAGAVGDFCRLVDGTEVTRNTLGEVAWFRDNSNEQTHPVGQKQPNAFGLYDMHGNVSERTSTTMFEDSHHVRGGNCSLSPGLCSLNDRSGFPDQRAGSNLGFRLCASGRADESHTSAARNPAIEAICADMIQIPFKNYKMAKYEVSQSQWEAVMGDNPSKFKNPNNPVENVSWDDCQEFLKKLNALSAVKKSGLTFRLPTDEEWEYACRAGATGKYCRLKNGSEITERTLGQVAWLENNSDEQTHPVGRKTPNAWGLYDMHGNVWEWTSTSDGEHRVSRGGSCVLSAGFCESSYRYGFSPSFRAYELGFRLCADGKAD